MKKVRVMSGILALALFASILTSASLTVEAANTGSKTSVQATVNLNKASAEELMTLKGIGPKTAERIIAYRQEQGPFQTVDQLVMVKGIGNAKFEKLKDQVTV